MCFGAEHFRADYNRAKLESLPTPWFSLFFPNEFAQIAALISPLLKLLRNSSYCFVQASALSTPCLLPNESLFHFSSFSHSYSYHIFIDVFSQSVLIFWEIQSNFSGRLYLNWTGPSVIPKFPVPLVQLSFILCFTYILILISSSLLLNIISSVHKLYTHLAYVWETLIFNEDIISL